MYCIQYRCIWRRGARALRRYCGLRRPSIFPADAFGDPFLGSMFPTWGLYGATPGPYPPPPTMLLPPPPLPGVLPTAMPPPQVPVVPPPVLGSYATSSANTAATGTGGFLSLREQHLVQLQQLQQMHQKQLQTVLLGGGPPPGAPPPNMPPPLPSSSIASISWQPPVPIGPPPARSYQKQFKHRDSLPPPLPRESQFRNPPMPPLSSTNEVAESSQPRNEWEPLVSSASPRMDMDMDLSSPPQSPSQSFVPQLEVDPYVPPPQPLPAQSQIPPPQSYQSHLPVSQAVPKAFSDPSSAVSQSYPTQSQTYQPNYQSSSQLGQPIATSASQPESHFTSSQITQTTSEPPELRLSSGPEKECEQQQSSSHADLSTMTPQEQQQYWYQQHLLTLQQRAKAHALGQQQSPVVNDAPEQRKDEREIPVSSGLSEPSLKYEPMLPHPNDGEPPGSSVEHKLNIKPPEDPEESLRLQQLQAAATQWQQHPQQRVGFQYQRIMQKHSQLQQILQRYQQIIQQPSHLSTATVEVQLQHYETQNKQFQPLYKEWEREFQQWQDQLQTYPHKDQLHEWHHTMKGPRAQDLMDPGEEALNLQGNKVLIFRANA
ncbi:YLP motif-containing protein 1 [Crotalus adamanteus]|uniref:YLP motif-containing protein 1 n=1 Tax=Crotalus adamanteus TaxID=8729 RepID=A0AAW1C5D0_CROAD